MVSNYTDKCCQITLSNCVKLQSTWGQTTGTNSVKLQGQTVSNTRKLYQTTGVNGVKKLSKCFKKIDQTKGQECQNTKQMV